MVQGEFVIMDYKKIFKRRELRLKLINCLRFIPAEPYLKLVYRIKAGKKLNLKNPVTFCDKQNWLKLHEVHPEKTEDKEEHDDYDCDYFVDEKAKTVSLTASGIAKAEKFFGVDNLGDADNATLSHHINQAMKARGLMKKDIDYVVKDGQIIIVDEFTGRLMYGRRYNEGLHQAIEAKERVTVAGESKTLATITFQNFFRLYDKLSGMTGTALTEEEEFNSIYAT